MQGTLDEIIDVIRRDEAIREEAFKFAANDRPSDCFIVDGGEYFGGYARDCGVEIPAGLEADEIGDWVHYTFSQDFSG